MLGEIHRLACSIDLQFAPVNGDSWLTSTLIDFVAFHFARHYPDVHFLPTNFALVDLPSAVRDPETLSVCGPLQCFQKHPKSTLAASVRVRHLFP